MVWVMPSEVPQLMVGQIHERPRQLNTDIVVAREHEGAMLKSNEELTAKQLVTTVMRDIPDCDQQCIAALCSTRLKNAGCTCARTFHTEVGVVPAYWDNAQTKPVPRS